MTYLPKFFAAVLLCGANAFAHEFWVHAAPFSPAVGGSAELTLHVGEYYVGEVVGVTSQHAASVKLHSASGVQNLTDRAPTNRVLGSLRIPFERAGTHLIAYDSHPSEVVLSADKFHAYLHEEGLDAVIRQRESAGTAAQPGRERFRRHAKALLGVGGQADRTALAAIGQRFELIPLSDPTASRGNAVQFAARFDGQPLASVLVKAWHKRGGQTIAVRARSDDKGLVTFEFPYPGPWMLNAVHMIPATGVRNIDWDSFWSSLTFEVPAAGRN